MLKTRAFSNGILELRRECYYSTIADLGACFMALSSALLVLRLRGKLICMTTQNSNLDAILLKISDSQASTLSIESSWPVYITWETAWSLPVRTVCWYV